MSSKTVVKHNVNFGNIYRQHMNKENKYFKERRKKGKTVFKPFFFPGKEKMSIKSFVNLFSYKKSTVFSTKLLNFFKYIKESPFSLFYNPLKFFPFYFYRSVYGTNLGNLFYFFKKYRKLNKFDKNFRMVVAKKVWFNKISEDISFRKANPFVFKTNFRLFPVFPGRRVVSRSFSKLRFEVPS